MTCRCGSWRWLDAEQRWDFWPSGTRRRKVNRCGHCGDALNADGTVAPAKEGKRDV